MIFQSGHMSLWNYHDLTIPLFWTFLLGKIFVIIKVLEYKTGHLSHEGKFLEVEGMVGKREENISVGRVVVTRLSADSP